VHWQQVKRHVTQRARNRTSQEWRSVQAGGGAVVRWQNRVRGRRSKMAQCVMCPRPSKAVVARNHAATATTVARRAVERRETRCRVARRVQTNREDNAGSEPGVTRDASSNVVERRVRGSGSTPAPGAGYKPGNALTGSGSMPLLFGYSIEEGENQVRMKC